MVFSERSSQGDSSDVVIFTVLCTSLVKSMQNHGEKSIFGCTYLWNHNR